MTTSTPREAVRIATSQAPTTFQDRLAVEGPVEIRVNGRGYAVTMRTPGADDDLARGFLVSEGVLGGPSRLTHLICEGDVVDVGVDGPGALVALDRQRHVHTTSSCGICGVSSIDAVTTSSPFDLADDATALDVDVLTTLPTRLLETQEVFAETGGTHAAAVFDVTGALIAEAEDVGRHNAVDKVVGHAFAEGLLPLAGRVLQVSGRASFELVQKAAMAGIPCLSAVSAPSSLAVELAESVGITLIGFSRGGAFNVYTHARRIEHRPS